MACYERWQQRSAEDPAWAEAHPVRMEVSRDGQGRIRLTFEPAMQGKNMV
ncbi:MAG: hypothetical protein ACI4ML_04960 [Aristaeellaceae bacterium]